MNSDELREEIYIVQSGDTLCGIAKRFNTSVRTLMDLNNLDSSVISPGQSLIVEENSDLEPSDYISYVVKKGDSLYSIANKYQTTVDAIKRYNNLTSNNLSIGQTLLIPSYMDTGDDENVLNYVTYIVEKNDTLYSIAQKFGTTVDKIKKDNNLTGNTLTVGSSLVIQDNKGVSAIEECFGEDFVLPNDYVLYTVQRGDSLYSIAQKFNTTVSEIQSLNNLTSTSLSIGQELKIPNGGGSSSGGSNVTTYIVQKGDSLYSIAQKFNTTVSEIQNLNNLTSTSLSIGQELKIPNGGGSSSGGSSNVTTYTVQKGESLYSIAKKFNTTVDEIKRRNNLSSNALSIGQELIIPTGGSGSENSPRTYTVQKGESLYSIAKKFNTTVDEIKRKNNLTSNALSIGQELII